MYNRLDYHIHNFIVGSADEITLNIKDLYPGIKKKDWNKKMLFTCKKISQLISDNQLNISFDGIIGINSTGTKRPAPRTINNRMTSSIFEPPEIYLKKGIILLPENCEFIPNLSVEIGLGAYYKQDYFDLWDIYLREVHITFIFEANI